jgi:hypothetical protein
MASDGLTVWLGEQRIDGRTVARVGRRGNELIAEFGDLGTLIANAIDGSVRFEGSVQADVSVLQKLRASVVQALARHAQGKMTMHASAVGFGSEVVVLVGPSGVGKSTLAAALCRQPNIEFVGDDTVAIDVPEDASGTKAIQVVPTQDTAWLLPDARVALGFEGEPAGKIAVSVPSAPLDFLSMRAVVGLVFDSDVPEAELQPLHGERAFTLLAGSLIRFVIDEPSAQIREFEQLKILARLCPVLELRRPRDIGQLNRGLDVIQQLLTSGAR